MSQKHIPDSIQQSLLQDVEVKVSDWVKDAIHRATKLDIHNHSF